MAFAEVLGTAHRIMKGRALPGPRNLDQIQSLLSARGTAWLVFEDVKRSLKRTDYLAGDHYSLADIFADDLFDTGRDWNQSPNGRDDHSRPCKAYYWARMRERRHTGLEGEPLISCVYG